jgi:hypothetical protein
MPLSISSVAQIDPGSNRIPRHSKLSGNAPTTTCARRSHFHWAAALCGNHLLRQLFDDNQSAPARSSSHACVTVFGEAEKVTHSFLCRNSLSQQGASHAPST